MSDAPGRSALWSRWSFASAAACAFWIASYGLRPLLPLRLSELGASDGFVGLAVALYPVASFGLAIPGGRLVDRVGLRRVLDLSLIGMAALGVAFGLTAGSWGIAALIGVMGIVELGSWLAIQALASHAGKGAFLRSQLAMFAVAWGLGMVIGPAAGGQVYERWGFPALALSYAATSAACLLCTRLVPYRREEGASAGGAAASSLPTAVSRMWGNVPVRVTLASSAVTMYVHGIRNSFYPLALERAGLSVAEIGTLVSVVGAASLLVRAVTPLLAKRMTTGSILVLGMWFAVAGVTVTPWLGSVWLWGIAAVVMGLGLGVNPPLTVELMAMHTSADERGLAMGLRMAVNRASQVGQSLQYGALVGLLGLGGSFLLSGALLALVNAWTGRFRKALDAPPG